MSGLAEILKARGHTVTGSDLVTTGHDPAFIGADVDRVVYTPAAREGSPAWPELESARARGIECLRLDQMLGELTHGKQLLAVTGAHGKSSSTGMLAHILVACGYNPTVLIGAPSWDGKPPYRVGDDDLWVLEADDYDRKFLQLHPTVALITNIDREHLDVYGSYDEIEAAFGQFVQQIQLNGHLIASNDTSLNSVVTAAIVPTTRYGADTEFDPSTLPMLPIIGEHMYLNAAGVIAAAVAFGVERTAAINALATFGGVGRRLERIGERDGVLVYDDYGHHPTEVSATLTAVKQQFPNRRLVVAFQPHQHSRVHALFAEFTTAFAAADRVLLVDIYAVPGRNEGVHVDTNDLASAIAATGTDVRYVGPLDQLIGMLDEELQPGDVLLTMGATDITHVGRQWIDEKQ